jgi:hypothetical protein
LILTIALFSRDYQSWLCLLETKEKIEEVQQVDCSVVVIAITMQSARTKSRTPTGSAPHGNVPSGNTDQEHPNAPASVLGDATLPVTTNDDNSNSVTVHSPVIEKIMLLCGFSADSTMARYIEQQQWTELHHVLTISRDEIKEFKTFRDDGSFEARPMQIHLCMFKAFLLYCQRKEHDWATPISEEDEYCCSADYFQDAAKRDVPATTFVTNPNLIPAAGLLPDTLTAQEFRRGVKRDKTHYEDLKDDKYSNSWNRSFLQRLTFTIRISCLTSLTFQERQWRLQRSRKFKFSCMPSLKII